MSYNGPSMRALDTWMNPGFIYENGKLRGNNSYKYFIDAKAGAVSFGYTDGIQLSAWVPTTLKDTDTKTLNITAKVTAIPDKPVTPPAGNNDPANKPGANKPGTTNKPGTNKPGASQNKKQALPQTGDSQLAVLPLTAGTIAAVAGAVLTGKSRVKDFLNNK